MVTSESLQEKVQKTSWFALLSEDEKLLLFELINSGEAQFLDKIEEILNDEEKQAKFIDTVAKFVANDTVKSALQKEEVKERHDEQKVLDELMNQIAKI